MTSHSGMRWTLAAIALLAAAVLLPKFAADDPAHESLVLYCAHDSVFADQIIRQFEIQTGIEVTVRYDEEANKSLGLTNLLIAEKEQPQCDVFWNNQTLGTIRLKESGVLEPYSSSATERIPLSFRDAEGYWTGFAGRLRVIVVNTDRMPATEGQVEELLRGTSLNDFAIAVPLYGTTLTHYSMLAAELGLSELQKWHRSLHARGIREARGNAASKDLVAEGACFAAFTDSDDAFVAMDQGKPVKMVPARLPSGKTMVIPNSVALIRNCRHPEPARRLIDYLLSAETELNLANSASRQIPLGPVDSERLSPEVRQLAEWAREGSDSAGAAAQQQAVLDWLMSEYQQP